MAYREKLNAGALWLIGTSTIILTVVTIVGLQAYFWYVEKAEWNEKVVTVDYTEISTIRANDVFKVNNYGIASVEAGTYSLPVRNAMAEIAEKY